MFSLQSPPASNVYKLLSEYGTVIGSCTKLPRAHGMLQAQGRPHHDIIIVIQSISPGVAPVARSQFDDEFLSIGCITAWPSMGGCRILKLVGQKKKMARKARRRFWLHPLLKWRRVRSAYFIESSVLPRARPAMLIYY